MALKSSPRLFERIDIFFFQDTLSNKRQEFRGYSSLAGGPNNQGKARRSGTKRARLPSGCPPCRVLTQDNSSVGRMTEADMDKARAAKSAHLNPYKQVVDFDFCFIDDFMYLLI